MYMPTTARLLFGSRGFSTMRATRPSASSAMPNASGFGTGCSRICEQLPFAVKLLNVRLNAAHDEVVSEVQHEPRFAQEITGRGHGVGDTERGVLLDVGDTCAEPGAIPHRSRHLLARLTDDDADVRNAGLHELLYRVEDHRLVGDRDELLGVRVGKGSQAAAFAAAEDQSLESAVFTAAALSRCCRLPVTVAVVVILCLQ